MVELAELASAADLVDVTVKPNFRALGKRFGSRTKEVAAAISAADPAEHRRLDPGRAATSCWREIGEITAEEVLISEAPVSGWAVETSGSETVALDLELTARAAPARAAARGDPDRAGGPQERRLRGHRPDRAALDGRRLT